ncbi:MAG TPA: carboxypeptidase-like regulatory domain-containing protein [Tepidisphaeraceae bacterium]|jgi:hypothetical protein|nr:carboxypeptidase-like regulatory domain-containing protein [Tepidisphaeraceae bacterium]
MLSFLRKCIIPAVVAAGMLGFSTIPFARAEDKPAAGAEVKKGSISGTVLDKDGKAISGAMVGVIKPQGRQGGGAGGNRPNRGGNNGAVNQATEDPKPAPAPEPGRGNRQRPEPLFKATTDADGKFTIKDVPAGDYVVMARVEGKGMARERVTVKADEAATVSLKLQDRPARGGGAGAGGNRPNRGGNAQ